MGLATVNLQPVNYPELSQYLDYEKALVKSVCMKIEELQTAT